MQVQLNKLQYNYFWVFALISIITFVTSILLYNPLPVLLPFGVLFAAFAIVSPKYLFYLFFAILPFSIEIHTASIGTDLPSEPIMILMTGMCFVIGIARSHKISKDFFINPVTAVITLHLLWIAFASITSTNQIYSFKYLLAKLWYVIPFFVLPMFVMKSQKDFRKIFLFLSMGLFIAIVYVLTRHALENFSFASSNAVLRPIFRNHVNYAIMLLAFLPYYWFVVRSEKRKNSKVFFGLLVLLLIAIYFSYTRAAQMSVVLAIVFYWIMHYRLVKLGVGLAIAGLIVFVMLMSHNNKYLDYAPDYSKTIAHKKFDNLVEATAKMEDISTVERFYRWVAGAYMVAEKPWQGFGPSTFYTTYDGYTVTSYQTYVSDNPEKSGIHNNYLMVAVEQGIPGLIIMLLVALIPLLYAEKVYHHLKDPSLKRLLMAAAMCYFVVDVTILINDLLEADKIGPLYFLSASIIVCVGVWSKKER